MREFIIRLGNVRDVQDFVSLSTARPFQVGVTDGHYTGNGKSFMEMFCLNLTAPLTVLADCSEDELQQMCTDMQRFLLP